MLGIYFGQDWFDEQAELLDITDDVEADFLDYLAPVDEDDWDDWDEDDEF